MAANNGNNDIVRKGIERHKFMPDGSLTPKLKLARIIYNENKLSFTNVETVRSIIRTLTGSCGAKRIKEADAALIEDSERPRNPYNIPKSDETIYEPYHLEGERILGLFDIHFPYHSISALTGAFNWAKKRNPDTILFGGDSLDCHQLSRFVRDPKMRHFADELNGFGELVEAIRKAFPKAKLVFKEGNHEERYNNFLYTKAKELSGVEEFKLENLIRKRAADIEYIGDKRIIKAGDLNIIHGHEFSGGVFSPVNIARGLFLKAKVSAIQGHNHQTSEHTETNMNEKITTTWSVGCLSELHPAYMPLNKWNHGFAFIEVDKAGEFDVQNKRIHKGEVL